MRQLRLEADDTVRLTSCGHPFHDACLRNYVSRQQVATTAPCPLCKQTLTASTLEAIRCPAVGQ